MDRNTLSTWGWIIVTTIIIAILIAAAVPFGKSITIGIQNSVDQAFGQGHECVAGAEATCTTPQVCTKCHKELAPALGHSPGPEATCTEDQVCTVCGAVITPAHGHNYTGGSCPDCGETAPCTHENLIYTPIEPTGYYNEVHTVSCQDCSYTATEDCAFNGTYAQHNEHSHFRLCNCGGAVSDAAHNLVDGVCTACGYGACTHENVIYTTIEPTSYFNEKHTVTCQDCGYTATEACSFNGEYTQRSDGHFMMCNCGGRVDHENHAWEAFGTEQHKCSKCNLVETCDVVYLYTSANKHSGQCETCGQTFSGEHNYVDYVCTICNGTCDHINDEGVLTFENGACGYCNYPCSHEIKTFDGAHAYYHYYRCDVCGTTTRDSHTYVDYVCTVCNFECDHIAYGSSTIVNGKCTECGRVTCTHENITYTTIEPTSYFNEKHTVTCQDCGYTATEACSFNGEYTQRSDGHFMMCNCGGRVDHENHAWEAFGTEQHKCSKCNLVETCDVTFVYDGASQHVGLCDKCGGYQSGGHSYVNYVCVVCEGECDHIHRGETTIVNGTCTECGRLTCTHETWEYYGAGQHACDKCGMVDYCNTEGCICKCGYDYGNHVWEYYSNGQHKCSTCGTIENCNGAFAYGDAYRHLAQCEKCGEYQTGYHTYVDYVCTVCNGECDHIAYGSSTIVNGTCTECGRLTCTHENISCYSTFDACDVCGTRFTCYHSSGDYGGSGSGSGSSCANGHTPGAAPTCTTPQTCTVCGTTIIGAIGHRYDEYNYCVVCGYYLSPAHNCGAHDFDGDGYCDICGQ